MNSRGYIPVICPMCDDHKFKGGFNSAGGFYSCWSCGHTSLHKIIPILTNETWNNIELKYKDELNARDLYLLKHSERQIRPAQLKLPDHTGPLHAQARRYLEARNFDSYELEELYKLQATNHRGEYNFRIIIPIYFEDKLVSYTSRDYTGRAELRYFSCRSELEIINHKDLLYGYDLVPTSHVIGVEGPVDKWAMGLDAIATFGTGFKQNQINLLGSFEWVTLLYDASDDARRKCDMLGDNLAGLGVKVDCIYLKEGDPGSLKPDERKSLIKDIMT
jgi:hypothetical protein